MSHNFSDHCFLCRANALINFLLVNFALKNNFFPIRGELSISFPEISLKLTTNCMGSSSVIRGVGTSTLTDTFSEKAMYEACKMLSDFLMSPSAKSTIACFPAGVIGMLKNET